MTSRIHAILLALAAAGCSSDGGRTWRLATRTPFPGAIYGLVGR